MAMGVAKLFLLNLPSSASISFILVLYKQSRDSGCALVGRVVASGNSGPPLESSDQQIFYNERI